MFNCSKYDDLMQCSDQTCISNTLRCNNVANCPLEDDERYCVDGITTLFYYQWWWDIPIQFFPFRHNVNQLQYGTIFGHIACHLIANIRDCRVFVSGQFVSVGRARAMVWSPNVVSGGGEFQTQLRRSKYASWWQPSTTAYGNGNIESTRHYAPTVGRTSTKLFETRADVSWQTVSCH